MCILKFLLATFNKEIKKRWLVVHLAKYVQNVLLQHVINI